MHGVLLVPAFAIGRTQELVWVLDDLVRDGRIPRVPLYLDSPMASKATEVYANHPETYDEETIGLASFRRLAAPVPGPAVHRLGRGVEGNSPRQSTDHGRRLVGHAHRRQDHASPEGLPARSEGARCCSLATRARERSAVTSPTAGGRRGSTARKWPSTAAFAPSAASAPTPISTSSRHGWSTSAGPARVPICPKTVFLVHGDPDAAEAFSRAHRIRSSDETPTSPSTARSSPWPRAERASRLIEAVDELLDAVLG